MEGIFESLQFIEMAIDTKTRRHLAGGILLKVFLCYLVGWLSTILTGKKLKREDNIESQ